MPNAASTTGAPGFSVRSLSRSGAGSVRSALLMMIRSAGLFDSSVKIPDVAGWLNAAAFETAHHHNHNHDPNRHDARIAAFCLTLEDPLDWQGLAMWLEMLVASSGENLLRVKGILNLKGHDRPVAIHAVRHLMHPPVKLAAWPEGDPRTSRIVFITRDLSRAVIEDGLRAFQEASQA